MHISAFPNDGSRPTIGETLTYELGRGKQGKPQAVKVVRAAIGNRPSRTAAAASGQRPTNWVGVLVSLAIVADLGSHGYKSYRDCSRRLTLEQMPVTQESSEAAARHSSAHRRTRLRPPCAATAARTAHR